MTRVLLLEDYDSDALLIEIELRRADPDLTLECVANRRAFETLLDQLWDIILADYVLLDFDALDALRILHEREVTTPLIVVTGAAKTVDAAVACMRAGAKDFILKDDITTRLNNAVKLALSKPATTI